MKTLQLGFIAIVSLLWTSCNVYKPFNSTNSADDYLEEAQACLHEGNYDCAITNYLAMPAGETKDQKLCLVYLSKSGLTLNSLINVVTQQSSNMLGSLAQALTPWTSTRGADAASAKTYCNTYAASATGNNAKTAILLKNLAYLHDCATRMAKTDIYLGNDNTDTACTTAGNRNGVITQADIGSNTGPFMCKADVDICQTDVAGLDATGLGNAGANQIKDAVNLIPANISGGATTDIVRTAIQSTVN